MTITLYRGDLPSDVKFKESVAVDTETLGLKPHRDRLCLVQLSAGDGHAHLVQIKKDQKSAPNLQAVLSNSNVIKIFHFARFDLAVLKKYLGTDTKSVYCTKIASRLVRTYTNQHGLQDICRELIGVELSKLQQSSDWGADELSQCQKEYAASDVLYLHRLVTRLNVMLKRTNRLKLAQACFNFLQVRVQLDLAGWEDEDIFSHRTRP